MVHALAIFIHEVDIQCVELGCLGRPQFRILNHDLQTGCGAFQRRYRVLTVLYSDPECMAIHRAINIRRQFYGAGSRVRTDMQVFNIGAGNLLHPDRLPNPGNARVPDAFRFQNLFPPELPFIGGILHANQEFIFALANGRSHIESKGRAALMISHAGTVQPDLATIIHGLEIK